MAEVNFTDAPGGSPQEVAADAAEAAKVEAARAELVDEQATESGLILGKYESTDELAAAYQNLQREYSKLKDGSGDEAPAPAEEAPTPVSDADSGEDPVEAEADSGGISGEQLASIKRAGQSCRSNHKIWPWIVTRKVYETPG